MPVKSTVLIEHHCTYPLLNFYDNLSTQNQTKTIYQSSDCCIERIRIEC